jgi:DNA helicase-2/ATP-dependent DNA helicase PcrA
MGDLLEGLNKQQRRAVEHEDGPLMVLAGPGTGKTRVITHRIARMIVDLGVEPESIVAVTYTVKAAAQLRERLAELVGAAADRVNAHTFHGLGYRLVRRFADVVDLPPLSRDEHRNDLIDSAQQRRLLRRVILEHGLFPRARARGVEAAVSLVQDYLGVLNDAAVSTERALEFAGEARGWLEAGRGWGGKELDAEALAAERERLAELEEAARAVALFQGACRERGWLTFADLIALPIRILGEPGPGAIVRDGWRHLVVDEFQDVNTAQIELLRRLAPPIGASGWGPDLCVVGDDDQSIYEFRGADDRAFARFAATWAGAARIDLSANYRSALPIITACNSIIARSDSRFAPDKVITPPEDGKDRHGPGTCVECVNLEDDKQDGEVIAAMVLLDRAKHPARSWNDYAVVARTHGDLERVRVALAIEGVPAVASRPAAPADDEGVKDVLAWVQILAEPKQTHAAVRLLVRPPISAPLDRVRAVETAYRAALSRFQEGDEGAADPGGFVDWLAREHPGEPGVARLVEWHHELRRLGAERPAAEVVFRAATMTGVAHADLLSARERAERVAALVSLLRFARQRQERLDQPGDVRAFWRYYLDLDPRDRTLADTSAPEDRIEGVGAGAAASEPAEGVRLITAHSAKGLEFHTVFVPRVSPRVGYPQTTAQDGPELPEGLLDRGDGRTARERRLAEERRVFYVACTRAEHRLVLLAKKNKSPSKSTHFFEELVRDAGLSGVLQVREGAEALRQAAEMGLGRRLREHAREDAPVDAEGRSFKAAARRREVFERARRDLRLAAAGALDRAEGAPDHRAGVEAAGAALAEASARLAALAYAERHGRPPAWAEGSPAGAFAAETLARAGGEEEGGGEGVPAAAMLPPPSAPLPLSYTYVSDYLRCPRCFYVKYVLGLDPMPGEEQVVGVAAHEALERFYRQVRAADAVGEPRPGRDTLLRLGKAAFFRHWPHHLEADRLQLDQVLAQLGLVFDRLHDPGANILEIEKRVEFPYGPHRFSATMDRIDQIEGEGGAAAFRIVDYKTGQATARLREPAPDDLQMGVYAMALGHLYADGGAAADALPGVAEYWILSSGERGRIALGDLRHDKIRSRIDEAVEGILAGRWERGPDCAGDCDILGPTEAALTLAAERPARAAARPKAEAGPKTDPGPKPGAGKPGTSADNGEGAAKTPRATRPRRAK